MSLPKVNGGLIFFLPTKYGAILRHRLRFLSVTYVHVRSLQEIRAFLVLLAFSNGRTSWKNMAERADKIQHNTL
jgi:hypothetical protein